jgi:arylsulfatase A-like enzyme
MDVVPTLLYLLGLPVPKSMDGRVLRDALAPQWLAEHPIVYSETEEAAGGGLDSGYTPEEEAEFKSRLRSLGYLD